MAMSDPRKCLKVLTHSESNAGRVEFWDSKAHCLGEERLKRSTSALFELAKRLRASRKYQGENFILKRNFC